MTGTGTGGRVHTGSHGRVHTGPGAGAGTEDTTDHGTEDTTDHGTEDTAPSHEPMTPHHPSLTSPCTYPQSHGPVRHASVSGGVSEWGMEPMDVHLRIYELLEFYGNALKLSSPVRLISPCIACTPGRIS